MGLIIYIDDDGNFRKLPDGLAGQYLTTDGAGNLSWTGGGGVALSDLADVTITSIASGELLKWNGSAWINNTLAEAGIQAADADLDALAALSSTGLVTRTGAGAFSVRTLTAGSSKITATNGDGVSGNPTVDLGTVIVDDLSDVTITTIASGELLKWNGSAWINNTLAEAGIQATDADLDALAALSSTGLVARTGSATYSERTITGTSGEVDVSNGDGVSGNPTIGIADNAQMPGTEGINVAGGTTAQRPGTPIEGDLRKNTTDNVLEYHNGTSWTSLPTTAVGEWILLQSQTASAASTVDFTSNIDSTYDIYVFVLNNITSGTDNVRFEGLISDDGGTTWEAGASDYATQTRGGDSAGTFHTTSAGATDQMLWQPDAWRLGTGTGEAYNAMIYMYNAADSGAYTQFAIRGCQLGATATAGYVFGANTYLTTSAINGVQFFASSGTISGDFRLYGIKLS